MAKYDTSQTQMSALRTIKDFDIKKAQSALRVEDSLEYANFGPGSADVSENVTIIGKSMVIDGNVKSESPISVKGTVNGNISTSSDVGINGLVNGDIEAENINFSHAAIRGNSKADREVTIGEESVVIGDINSGSLVIDGKVKGNVMVAHNVLFKANSLMVGQVTAGGVNMEEGARINATITLKNKTSEYDDSEFDVNAEVE